MRIRLAVAVISVLLAGAVLAADSAHPTVLHAVRLIDGTGAAPIEDAVVIVRGERIEAVGPRVKVQPPTGAVMVELGEVTLLPGLIDAHVHLIGRTLRDPAVFDSPVKDMPSYGAILGVENARRTLMAGFTTVRNVGAPNFDDLALREAINEGRVPGPRMRAAAHAIGITGGHCDENGFAPGLVDGTYKEGIADGAEEAVKAVRYQVKYGADVIKICATGGVLSEGDEVGATQYTLEEMRAIVTEAHKLGRKVAAHAHGSEGIKLAVTAGVDSIEHGSFLDAEGAKMMAAHGTVLVPTLMPANELVALTESGILKGERAEKGRLAAAAMHHAIRIAVENHVPIALGTDAAVIPHGENARELTLMVDWGGMSPMAALMAGTSGAAKLLGWDDRLGSIEPGKLADIIAVPGNPLEDIGTTEHVVFVMKGGTIVKGASGKP